MRIKVLIFVNYYLPGYKAGGPLRSIANLVDHFGDKYDFFIVTSDRDGGEDSPYKIAKKGQWTEFEKATVMYLSPRERNLKRIVQIMRDTQHDICYLNSFFSPDFTLLPLLAQLSRLVPKKPTILAPRGEFSTGALALKRLKKRIYLRLFRLTSLPKEVVWQASTAYEASDIKRKIGSDVQVQIASDFPRRAAEECLPHKQRAPEAPLRVVFLSRITRMKNLRFALQVLKGVRDPVDFTVVGFIDDEEYWKECLALAKELPRHVKFNFIGSVHAEKVPQTFAEHDVFILPSLGENFGHVVIEALGAGTPVLLSDRTPWRNLVQLGVGWDLSLDDQGSFVQALNHLASMPPSEYQSLRRSCHQFAIDFSSSSEIAAENLALLEAARLRGTI